MMEHDALQFLRDLTWVLESPPLIGNRGEGQTVKVVNHSWMVQQFRTHQEWLHSLKQNPEALLNFLNRKPAWRVGRYFEQLIAFWLEHSPVFDLKAWNLQIRDGRRTLGELDFIFEDRERNLMLHWESSVKYYLGYSRLDGTTEWIGPNARDRLDLKLEKLLNHQARLSEKPETRKYLENRGISQVSPEIFMKGYLFYPRSLSMTPSPPQEASSSHLKGSWISWKQIASLLEESVRGWIFLEKPYWLSPAVTAGADQLLSHAKLDIFVQSWFAQSSRPLLVAGVAEKQSGQFSEITRCFIVSESWPGL